MDPDRRRALRLAGTGLLAGLAGCTGGLSGGTPTPSPTPTPTPPPPDADGDGVPDADDDFPDDDRRSRVAASREFAGDLEKGVWKGFGLTYDQQGVLSYEVTVESGPNIDVLAIPRDALSAFRNRSSYDLYPSMSQLATEAATVETAVPEGRYVLILDNTSRGRAQPGDGENTTASVQFSFTQSI